jgi:NitT/TauT family transport system substrate-binding protein
VADEIRIQFTRFSAFYTPLIATIAGGFLKEEGFDPTHSIAPPGKSAIESLVDGTADVITTRHRYEDVVAPPPGR